jgi:DNA (cytosine-5)-methyltransferase 1
MKVLDLFAGIGGFTLGLERAGFETVAFCEIEPYAQKVLMKNWPEVPIYDDVRDITAERLISDGIRVDVITGGFPCQDISLAGQKAGIEGERSGLWTECARLIGEIRPRYAIFENVTNLLNGDRGDWFKRVLWDISQVGYDAEWHCIPASQLGAHHHRDRVWIVAYPKSAGSEACSSDRLGDEHGSCGDAGQSAGASEQASVLLEDAGYGCGRDTQSSVRGQDSQGKRACNTDAIERPSEDVADTERVGQSRSGLYGGRVSEASPENRQASWIVNRCEGNEASWDAEPNVGRVANGIPSRSHRLKCLGNAVVPPIPQLIGEAIKEAETRESA